MPSEEYINLRNPKKWTEIISGVQIRYATDSVPHEFIRKT